MAFFGSGMTKMREKKGFYFQIIKLGDFNTSETEVVTQTKQVNKWHPYTAILDNTTQKQRKIFHLSITD